MRGKSRTSGIRCARTLAISRDAAGGRRRTRLQRRFRRHLRPDLGFTADGFAHRELRDYRRGHPLAPLASSRRVEDRAPGRAGRADLCRVLDPAACGARRRSCGAARGAREPRMPSVRRASSRPAMRNFAPGFRRLRSEADLLDVNFLSNGRLIRLRDIATVRRGFRSAAADVSR